ncbi:MAG: ATP-binding cassette domain-containing protein [Planctomycetota bacterium]
MITTPPPTPTPRPADEPAASSPTLLQVRGLTKRFLVKKPGEPVPLNPFRRRPPSYFSAVDRVSFDLYRGETLGIVGESGSGKTTCARCVLRALTPTSGQVLLHPDTEEAPLDLATLPERQLTPLRRQMQMIFQDPFASLNPRMTVGDIVGEPLRIHGLGSRRDIRTRVAEMLRRVGLEPAHMSRYPHAFSGGQRQRIGIARALILRPSLVVADEAVSALDVSVQTQVLELLKELQQEMGLTYIFVSHDLSVVRHVCDRVAVMYRGRIVELGDAEQVFSHPQHEYTKVLLSAIPYPDPDRRMKPMRTDQLTPEQLLPLPHLR